MLLSMVISLFLNKTYIINKCCLLPVYAFSSIICSVHTVTDCYTPQLMKYWDYTDVIQQFVKVGISNSFHSFHVIFELKLDTNDLYTE